MPASTALLIAIGFAIASLVMLAYVNHREEQQAEFGLRSRQLKLFAQSLEDKLPELETLIQHPGMYRVLAAEVTRRYQKLMEFDPNAKNVSVHIMRSQQNEQRYEHPDWARPLNRIRGSDQTIFEAEKLLQEIKELLQTLFHHKIIDDKQLGPMLLELDFNELAVEVVSGVAQGHQLYTRGDFVDANAHYFHAQKTAMQSKIHHPQRQQFIDELGEIINRKRLHLSPEIMPETQYNPEVRNSASAGTRLENSLL